MSTKKFVNEITNCVTESLKGFVRIYPGLHLHEEYQFVTKKEMSKTSRVAIISGGGSGHEPFCVGYVGDGMLTAAVAGNIFASPSKAQILQAIHYINKYYQGGILVIIPNYTGDCLNFGMAIEEAKNENINIDSVIVGEDCASDQNRIAGRRGMCGLLHTFKLAGALATKGENLKSVTSAVNDFVKNMSTLGITSKPCSLPGQPPLFKIEEDKMELGTGVHGEAGIKRIEMNTAKEAVCIVLEKLCKSLDIENNLCSIVVTVNNLGATTQIEQNVICNEVYTQLENKGISIKRMYAGMIMTSLDMEGFQISLIKISQNNHFWIELLDAKTDAPKWVGSQLSIPMQKASHSEIDYSLISSKKNWLNIKLAEGQKNLLKKCLNFVSNTLIENEIKLNELDSGCGDGDCGSTLVNLAKGINNITDHDYQYLDNVFYILSSIAENKMGGTSGALYAICFRSILKYFSSLNCVPSALEWANAWKIGIEIIKKYGHSQIGYRTLIDSAEPGMVSFNQHIHNDPKNVKYALQEALKTAKQGCDATKFMKASVGRASYVNQERLTNVDAGAFAFVLCLDVIYQCVSHNVP